jgi:hypothetical protein
MTLFRHRRPAEAYSPRAHPYSAGIARFWAWWARVRGELTAAVDDQDRLRARTLLGPEVGGIDRDLTWYTGPGLRARHMLVVSGARHPALRVVAERWRRAGPPDDAIWEFHPAMPAEPAAFEALVQVAGIELEPGEAATLVRLDDLRFRMDVSVFHPAFGRLDQVTRTRVANVLVGWALGEDDTDRWIGQIDATTVRPLDSVPAAMLGALTSQLSARWSRERWATLEGAFGRSRLVAAVRHPLHRVDHPLFDEHIAVRLPYQTAEPDGQPGPDAEQDLSAAREAIVRRLGPDAVLVATQTADGEQLVQFYADSAASPVEAVRAVLREDAHTDASVAATYDPGWDVVEHLRVASSPD